MKLGSWFGTESVGLKTFCYCRLTTASLSGGWVPGMSKGFHFWQPAPRLNNAPMAGTMLQASHEPPRIRDKKQVPVTLKRQWKEKKGGEGGESWLTESPRAVRPTPHE